MNTASEYIYWQDAADEWAALETERKSLLALPPDTERRVKEIEGQQKALKIRLQGECAVQGATLTHSHVQVVYKPGTVRVNLDRLRYGLDRMADLASSDPVMGEMVRLIESALTTSDPTGSVILKEPLSEVELRRWNNNKAKEMAK